MIIHACKCFNIFQPAKSNNSTMVQMLRTWKKQQRHCRRCWRCRSSHVKCNLTNGGTVRHRDKNSSYNPAGGFKSFHFWDQTNWVTCLGWQSPGQVGSPFFSSRSAVPDRDLRCNSEGGPDCASLFTLMVCVTAIHSYLDSLHYGSFKHIRKDCSGIRTANSHASGSQDDGYKTIIVETPPRKATHLMSRVGLGRVGCCRPHKGQIFSWFLTGSTTRPNLPGGSGASSQDVARCHKPLSKTLFAILCLSVCTFL